MKNDCDIFLLFVRARSLRIGPEKKKDTRLKLKFELLCKKPVAGKERQKERKKERKKRRKTKKGERNRLNKREAEGKKRKR